LAVPQLINNGIPKHKAIIPFPWQQEKGIGDLLQHSSKPMKTGRKISGKKQKF
jgi:hypothetical protein